MTDKEVRSGEAATVQKRADSALQESEERYRALFDNSPDSYLILAKGIVVDCNRAAEAMLRGDRSRIVGQSLGALSLEFQPDGRVSAEAASCMISDAQQMGSHTFEWLHRRFDGSTLWVEVSLSSLTMQEQPTVFASMRDITERKQAEEALQESLDRWRVALDAISDIVCLISSEHTFLAINETGVRAQIFLVVRLSVVNAMNWCTGPHVLSPSVRAVKPSKPVWRGPATMSREGGSIL